ncbi:MAG: hypothetical protein KDA44_22175, partial [Planctomycetales bacterium]|nr:hypothetical protein [Planctomycetales bacterium]
MNETNHTPEDRESWADALVDRGLRESLGQETPPDLRERILAAASQEGTLTPSTLEDAKMADHNSPRPARRIAYALLAAAGCVLIAITVWPALQANREAARRAPATDASTVTGDESQDSRDLERGLKATAKPTGPTTDDDTTILSAGVANDASQAESDQLMMLATPHIIIQEEEEVRLGLTVEGAVVDETPQPQNNVGLEGLLNDAYGSPRVQGSGVPFRQGSFGAPAPEVANGTDGVVASDRGYAGVAGDSALVDRSGQAANGNELATLPQGPPNGGVQGGRQQIPTPYYLLDDVQYGIGPEFHPSNAGIQGAPNNRLQWGDYQTPGQTRERYAERGATGADSQRLVELQDNQKFLQAEIAQLAQRGETVSAADRQQAALANDPMIANYRQQLFAVDNMIMQRRAIERRADSPEVQRLQQSKKEIETMLAAYERKLAEDLVDLDVSVTTEQVLAARRQRLETWQRELVRVEQELRELQQDQGQGPAAGGDQYARIYDNPFKPVSAANTDNRLSTFSIDVDTA